MLKYVHADYLKDLDDFALKSIALKLSVICHYWERNYIDMKFILRCISLNFEVLNYIFNKFKNELLFLLGDEEFMNFQLPF